MDIRVAGVYNSYQVYNAANSKTVKANQTDKVPEGKDGFTLSVHAEDYQLVRSALASSPDMREDKVSDIKARIEAGQYMVSASEVAQKILQSVNREI